jgi:signal peptide peptidase SppA
MRTKKNNSRLRRRVKAAAAIAEMRSAPWAMNLPAMGQTVAELQVMLAGGGWPAVAQVQGTEKGYSRKVRRAGSAIVIPVVGVIEPERGVFSEYLGGTACSELRDDFRLAAGDSSVREIWMLIDSPGGSTYGLAETVQSIATAAGKKPVVAYCRNMACSAAYLLATAASRIVATDSTLVGSVGTMIDHMSYAGMLAQAGIKNSPITFGANKGEGSPWRDLTGTARAGVQSIVDAYGRQFVGLVARGRGVTVEQVQERFGQGRLYIASEALERGMIDAIGLLEEAKPGSASASTSAQQQATSAPMVPPTMPAAEVNHPTTPRQPSNQPPEPTPHFFQKEPRMNSLSFSSGEDVFSRGAVDAILARIGMPTSAPVPPDLQHLSLFEIGCIASQKQGLTLTGTPEDQALAMLQQGPALAVMGADSAYNRPGSFPNLLSNLVGKILDTSMTLAEATYADWTQRLPDHPTFNPRPVVAISQPSALDEQPDGEPSRELRMSEEYMGWFQTGQFANHIKLTPRMIANDDMDAFVQSLGGLSDAHELTLNDLCLKLLAGNAVLADNVALFHSTHNNLVSGGGNGGAPSSTTANANRVKHRQQTGVGTSSTISSLPRVALVPVALEDAAKQTYYTVKELVQLGGGETKVAATDANINVHRGTVKVVVEPGLDAYSTAAWYTFDTRLRTIVHGFQTGYSRGGKRTTWFDNHSGSRLIKLEGRFGAAAVGYRGAVQNAGS